MSTSLFLPNEPFTRDTFNSKLENIDNNITATNNELTDTFNQKITKIETDVSQVKTDATGTKSELSAVTNNLSTLTTNFNSHKISRSNPHGVTATQIGAVKEEILTVIGLTKNSYQYTLNNVTPWAYAYKLGKMIYLKAKFYFEVKSPNIDMSFYFKVPAIENYPDHGETDMSLGTIVYASMTLNGNLTTQYAPLYCTLHKEWEKLVLKVRHLLIKDMKVGEGFTVNVLACYLNGLSDRISLI